MKVASAFSMEKKDQNEFNMWLETIPCRLRGGLIELLWLKAKKVKTVVWTWEEGFVFFNN